MPPEPQKIDNCLKQCPDEEIRRVLQIAATAAAKAGEILLGRYEKPHQVKHKGTIDLVTEADLASEEIILAQLHRDLPGIKILSEESFSFYAEKPAEPIWIIDPLDGTTNFAHNFPWFSVSIAFYDRGRSRAGIIYNPILNELFCAALEGGAWLNNRPIRVSTVNLLHKGLVATGFPYNVQERPDAIVAMLREVLMRAQGIRRPGAATLDLAYLACGRLDAFWEVGLKPWDSAAGGLLVEEAGGRMSDFAGSPFSPFVPELLGTNGLLHEDLVTILQEFSRTG